MSENELTVSQSFNPLSLMPATFNEKYQMAQLLSKSGLIPQSLNTPEKVCVALQWGHELQLSPMVAVNNITVINGKPTLSADVMAAVVKRSPEYGGIEWVELTDTAAECVVTRKGNGYTEKTRSRFTIQEAQNAGLCSKDVWKKYPRRMLKHRCLSYALRDAFPDILAGLYNPEEMESVTASDVTTEAAPVEKNITDQTTVTFEAKQEEKQESHTEYERLYKLTKKYEANLKKSASTPTPYVMACECLAKGNEGECADMYLRCVSWLGKTGFKVE